MRAVPEVLFTKTGEDVDKGWTASAIGAQQAEYRAARDAPGWISLRACLFRHLPGW